MKRVRLPLLFLSCLFFQSIRVFSQSYVQDPTFEPVVLRNSVSRVEEFAVQADGKIVAFGTFHYLDSLPARKLARLHPSGRIDTTFKIAWLTVEFGTSMAIQPDGKIILAGGFFLPGVSKKMSIIRLNTNGSLDTTFGMGGEADAVRIDNVVMQSADKIIITGGFTSLNGLPVSYIARLNLDGSIDPTYIPLTSLSGTMNPMSIPHVAIQPDGKIVIAGAFTTVNGKDRKRFARLHQDGRLDESFIPSTNTEIVPIKIALSGPKLVAVGYLGKWFFGTPKCAMERFNEDGSLDESFQKVYLDKYDFIERLAVQPDGKMIIGGFYDVDASPAFGRGKLLRVNTNGSIDDTFQFPVQVHATRKIAYNNGKLLVAGSLIPVEERLFQLDLTGSLDNTFQIRGEEDGVPDAILPTSDNAFLIAGNHKTVNGKLTPRLYRVLADGRVDPGFTTTSPFHPVVSLPDGNALVRSGNSLQRLTPTGSLDASFKSGTFNSHINQVTRQTDGKIVVGGYFDTYNGTASGSLLRLNEDGSLDNTFNAKAFTKDIERLVIQPDGKIVVAAYEYTPQKMVSIVQFNPDGSVNRSLQATTDYNSDILALTVQPDGKVLIGGYFQKLGDYAAASLARLNADLTIDNTFKGGNALTAKGIVRSILLQPDEKMLITGPFSTLNNLPYGGLARLHSDGSLDTSFKLANPIDASSSVVVPQGDGKLVIGFPGKIARFTLPLEQTIAFASIPDKLTSDAPFKLTATASSGLAVRFSLVSGPATLVGDSIKLIGTPGVVTVQATQEGNTYYKTAAVEKSFTVQAVLGAETETESLAKVYPNPATHGFTVELPPFRQFRGLHLISAQGKVLTPSGNLSGRSIRVDTRAIPAGVYVLRAFYDGKELKRRILIK